MQSLKLFLLLFISAFSINFSLGQNNISLLGRWPDGVCKAVTSEGDIFFIGNGCKLEIIDYSIPGTPGVFNCIALIRFMNDIYA